MRAWEVCRLEPNEGTRIRFVPGNGAISRAAVTHVITICTDNYAEKRKHGQTCPDVTPADLCLARERLDARRPLVEQEEPDRLVQENIGPVAGNVHTVAGGNPTLQADRPRRI